LLVSLTFVRLYLLRTVLLTTMKGSLLRVNKLSKDRNAHSFSFIGG
jgi:hypothetical protein